MPNIVSLPVGTLGKRDADEEVDGLETKAKGQKHNKKHKSR